jgi:hypothetical protein
MGTNSIPPKVLAGAEALLKVLCDSVPESARDQVENRYRLEGSAILLYEWRRNSKDDGWHEESVAKFLYVASQDVWQLYMMRADGKWHRYWVPRKFEAKRFSTLLKEVENDPTDIFWG